MSEALLVIGHGSKSKDVPVFFDKLINRIKQISTYNIVLGAHMELCEPSVETQVNLLRALNVRVITIVPYFLYKGIHIKKDIPFIIKGLKEKFKNIQFILAEPLGYEPVMAELVLRRAKEAAL